MGKTRKGGTMSKIPGVRWGRVATMCFVGAAALIAARVPLLAQQGCPGDCNGDGMVAVNELVTIVDIALGTIPLSQCRAADVDSNGNVVINEMVEAVDAALNGCPPAPPTATSASISTSVSTSTPTPEATPIGASCGSGGTQFSSTYAAIQQQIFQNHGCTQQACHGTATNPQGSLNLLPDVAYQNIFQQPSSESGLLRLDPGEELKSYLYLKLLAATNPSAVPPGAVSGSPMPFGLPPLSASELDALRLWIVSGAPQTGTVEGTEAELNACLPTPAPI